MDNATWCYLEVSYFEMSLLLGMFFGFDYLFFRLLVFLVCLHLAWFDSRFFQARRPFMAAGVAKACAPQGSAWKEIRPWSKSRRSTPDGTLASPAKLAVTRTTQAMRCGHTFFVEWHFPEEEKLICRNHLKRTIEYNWLRTNFFEFRPFDLGVFACRLEFWFWLCRNVPFALLVSFPPHHTLGLVPLVPLGKFPPRTACAAASAMLATWRAPVTQCVGLA